VGNFSFYDPLSGILFSGDIGASLGGEEGQVENFADHLHSMTGFHRRYMASNRACRLWVAMVRKLAPRMIVPQHGGYFVGEQVGHFLDWLAALECGVDLLDSQSYRLPVSEQSLTFNK
jgi:flavorubredoxin